MILLHGYGADEHDLLPIAHELDPRLRAVSLQGPVSLGGGMRAWFNLTMAPRGMSFDDREVRAGVEAAAAPVEGNAQTPPRPIPRRFSHRARSAVGVRP